MNDRYYSTIMLIDRRFKFRIITHNFANVDAGLRLPIGRSDAAVSTISCTQSSEVALLLINRRDSVVSFEPSHNLENGNAHSA